MKLRKNTALRSTCPAAPQCLTPLPRYSETPARWRDVQPEDKDLRRYRDWLQSTDGLGTGLSRHRTMDFTAPPAGA